MQFHIKMNVSRIFTQILLIVNIVMYICLCLDSSKGFWIAFAQGPSILTLVKFGAKVNGLIDLGQFYRFVFPIFIHANLVHLIFNMMGLWYIGGLYEYSLGKFRFILTYLLSGIAGNIFSYLFVKQISVGASGALFGIFLSLFVIYKYEDLIAKTLSLTRNQKSKELEKILIVNILLNVFGSILFPVFDWACHLGGSLAGCFFGLYFISKHFDKMHLSFQKVVFKKFIFIRLVHNLNHFKLWVFIPFLIFVTMFTYRYLNSNREEKIFGAGVYEAAWNSTAYLTLQDIGIYQEYLNREFPNETLPKIWELTENLIQKEQTMTAFQLLMIFSDIEKNSYLSSHYLLPQWIPKIQEYKSKLFTLPMKNQPLSEDKENQIFQFCLKTGNTYYSLGFYDISYALFHCAAQMNKNNSDSKVKMTSSQFLIQNSR